MKTKLMLLLSMVLILALGVAHATVLIPMASSTPNIFISDGTTQIRMDVFPDLWNGYECEIWRGTTLVSGFSTFNPYCDFTGLTPSTVYTLKVRGFNVAGTPSGDSTTIWQTFGIAESQCRTTTSIPTIENGVVSYASGGCNDLTAKTLTVLNNGLGVETQTTQNLFPISFSVTLPNQEYLTRVERTLGFTTYRSYSRATSGSCSSPSFNTNIIYSSNSVSWNSNPDPYYSYTYELRRGASLEQSGTTLANSGSLTGLTPLSSYTLKIIGLNVCGNGYSTTSSFTTDNTPISPVTDFDVELVGLNSTFVNVTANPDILNSYEFSLWNSAHTTLLDGASTTNHYYPFYSLTPSTTYITEIKAINGTCPDNCLTKSATFTTPSTVFTDYTTNFTSLTAISPFSIFWEVGFYDVNGTYLGWLQAPPDSLTYDFYFYNSTGALVHNESFSNNEGYTNTVLNEFAPNELHTVNYTVSSLFGGTSYNGTGTVTTDTFNTSDYTIYAIPTETSVRDYNLLERDNVDVELYAVYGLFGQKASGYSYIVNDSNGNLIDSKSVVTDTFIVYNLDIGENYTIEMTPSISVNGVPYVMDTKVDSFTPEALAQIECNEGTFNADFTYTITQDGTTVKIKMTPDYPASEDIYIISEYSVGLYGESGNQIAYKEVSGNRPEIVFNNIEIETVKEIRISRNIACTSNTLKTATLLQSDSLDMGSYNYGVYQPVQDWSDLFFPSQMAKFLTIMLIFGVIGVAIGLKTGNGYGMLASMIIGFIIAGGLGWVPSAVYAGIFVIVLAFVLYLAYSQLKQ